MSMRLREKSKLDYQGLHISSTASELEILEATSKTKRRKDVYQAEEVLAEKKVSFFSVVELNKEGY